MKRKRLFGFILALLIVAMIPWSPGSLKAVADENDTPNIAIVSMGGTIVSKAMGRDLFQSYAPEGVTIADVVYRIQPEISAIADLEIYEVHENSTKNEYLYDMSKKIDEVLADENVDGVVVNAGTNTLEEVAYFADLTVQSDKPVVVTGSMRQTNTFSFDGEANLFNAIRLAASGETTCYGTVVMLNDEFFAAREVTKSDALRLDTFDGGRYGALGTVDENRIRTVRAPARVMECGTDSWKTPFDLTKVEASDLAKVEIVYTYTEADGLPITALTEAGVDGIVTAGTGAGSIMASQQEAREAAIKKGVVFVSATRAGSGAVYDNNTPGIIGAADLLPQKARILLQLSLTFTDDPEQVRTWFKTIGVPEFNMSRFRG